MCVRRDDDDDDDDDDESRSERVVPLSPLWLAQPSLAAGAAASRAVLSALRAPLVVWLAQVPLLDPSTISFDTVHHGSAGGDNYAEGNLDTQMIAAFGLGVATVVSNTNTSASTEEGDGFGAALLDFVTELANRETVRSTTPPPRALSCALPVTRALAAPSLRSFQF